MKNKILRRNTNPVLIKNKLIASYETKYYDLYMDSMKWEGLDDQEKNFVMKQFWTIGTVGGFPDREKVDTYFMPYAGSYWNIYDFPEVCRPCPRKDFNGVEIRDYINGVDCVIGFANDSHTPIHTIVRNYIERMADVDMTIRTNLALHKLPFFANVSQKDTAQAKDILDNMQNDEIAVFVNGQIPLTTVSSNTPYIIDKLYQYRVSLENELLTYLGLDNSQNGDYERLLVDQVNANNAQINASQNSVLHNFETFAEQLGEVLGKTVKVEPTAQKVASVHEEQPKGEEQQNGMQ